MLINISKIYHFLIYYLFFLIFYKKKLVKKEKPKNIVNYLFSENLSYITPWQQKDELINLAEVVDKRSPKVILEIGTARGGTLLLWARICSSNAIIISIDLPGGNFGGGYPVYKSILYKSFKQKNQIIKLIRSDSHSEYTLSKVKKILNGKKIDYLFIDGDHSYHGVKKDYHQYKSLCSTDAIIGIHDINIDNRSPRQIFVSDFWDEIKNQYKTKELFSIENVNAMGIGVIYYGKNHTG
ncbi:MAG: class I SAM-dependent methyltransferase [Candidatus Marinimicrobia bacterium]|jgi:cephalosporin hydroxylase|nr:class I SAM-dependent methyltransferase [Candidatus Neomarinimicrobiota bacterium]MBT4735479.1 class I SAM-dependent methyltransferase [Candidatus Neomarinimicrobiota bacterium]MBT7901513.1 class I SAM-dependent methyltransferase [Candidatus Neomarinimicrobiota bacterium]